MSKETELREALEVAEEALEVAENELYNYLKRPELPNIPKGTPLLVWGQYETKEDARVRYFSHWNEHGKCCCYPNGTTQKSFSDKHYPQWPNWDYAPDHGNIYAWVPNDETVPKCTVMVKLREDSEYAVKAYEFESDFWRIKGKPSDVMFIAKL